jgi:hypothetical protein
MNTVHLSAQKTINHTTMKHYLLSTILLFANSILHAQVQKGADIDGKAAGDNSGYSISMPDANTIAIGAIYNDDNGTDAGQVRIFTWNSPGGNWVQKGSDINGEAAGDFSGTAVSMPDANTVAIGAPENSGGGTIAGHVRIYAWNGISWTQKGSDIDGKLAGDYSGYSVSMPDANTVAIGAIGSNGTGLTACGTVRIYIWSGNNWVQKGTDLNGEAANDYSGVSVSMPDANTVAIGAPSNDGNGSGSGQVRIYSWNGTSWIQKGIDLNGEAAQDDSGVSVSMPDSNTVAIGADLNDGNGSNSGHVRIYKWNGSAWIQKGADINGKSAGAWAGVSVSMADSNNIAIGALNVTTGNIRIYTWNGNSWMQRGNDNIMEEAVNDGAGASVSMPDLNTAAFGAPANDGNGTDAGHARVYRLYCTIASNVSLSACKTYTVPSGKHTYSASGNYTDTIQSAEGCDSVINIALVINNVDTTVTLNHPVLTAGASGAIYQWLDCNNAKAVIPGAIGRSYTATANGNYAVVVTVNGCRDTSRCYAITKIGMDKSETKKAEVYPNPGSGIYELRLNFDAETNSIRVFDIHGKLIQGIISYSNSGKIMLDLSAYSNGIYIVQVVTANGNLLLRLVKE